MTKNNTSNEVQTGGGPAGALPFIYGHVDPTLFPIDQMQSAAQEALRHYGSMALNYGVERGCGLLLSYLQAKLARDEGEQVSDDNLVLTAGASGGLDAICRLYTRPSDTVLVEAPSYHEALALIRDYPVQLAAVPMDDEGLIVEALAQRLQALKAEGARPRLLYTIPTFQNPSGVTLNAARRPALLELARRHQLLIVEDDVYRDLAFEANIPPTLYALDAADKGHTVIRLGSFSKILAPGLRLGWAQAAPQHIARLTGSGLSASGGGVNPFAAFVTAVFCQKGWLEPHIARLVRAYHQRRDVLLAALEDAMPDGVRWTRPSGGFFVWLTLPEALQAQAVLEQAHRRDITFLTGEPFFAQGGGQRHIRLPFSFISPPEMEQGIRTLAEIVRDMLSSA
jgi:DNA-binding transcriptional MocR family regulator